MIRPNFQLSDYLFAAAEVAPEKPCFVFPDGSAQSFSETEDRVIKLADALLKNGVAKGDRLAILSVDNAEYVETILACALIGCVFVPLNNRLRDSEIRTLLLAAQPKVLAISGRYTEIASNVVGGVDSIELVVDYDGGAGEAVPYEALISSGDLIKPDIEVHDADCAAIVFTSGTTGLPKGAMQSYKSLKTLFTHALINCELSFEGCGYSGSPLFHVGGYTIVFANIISRSATLMMPQFDATAILKCIDQGILTHCLFVPTMITMILEHPDCRSTSFKSLERIIYGAAPMSPDLLRRAIDTFGCDFVQVFGAATETGTQLVLTSKDHKRALAGEEHLLGSVGRPALSCLLRIVDEDGNDVPKETVGEIVTRSDQTMIGYLGMQEATEQSIKGGWFYGGDLGKQDEEGFVYLAGRSKDMIIRGGENTYPLEIELVISTVPGVSSVSVLGEPDDYWGETVLACITVNDQFAGVDHVVSACMEQLAKYKVPARIEILDEMPLNATGKISKPALREAERQGRAEKFGAKVAYSTDTKNS